MAQTKKNTKKANTKSKAKAKGSDEVIPDFYIEATSENGATVELSLYDRGEDKKDSVKLLIDNTFVIYCQAVLMEDYAFLSYPNFKAGDKYINQAFCIDKELNEKLNDALTGYYFE